MRKISISRKGIHFDAGNRGTNVFWYDLIHWHTGRGRIFFFRQLFRGIKLILNPPHLEGE